MNLSPPVSKKDPAPVQYKTIKKKQPEVDLLAIVGGLLEPFNAVRGEQALWRAVILQALVDAVSQSAKDDTMRLRQEARRWLLLKGDDFDQVCHLAGYAPDYIRRQVRLALARGCQWRASPAKTTGTPNPKVQACRTRAPFPRTSSALLSARVHQAGETVTPRPGILSASSFLSRTNR